MIDRWSRKVNLFTQRTEATALDANIDKIRNIID